MCVQENCLIREAAPTNQLSVTDNAGLRIKGWNDLNEGWGCGGGRLHPNIFFFFLNKKTNRSISGDWRFNQMEEANEVQEGERR